MRPPVEKGSWGWRARQVIDEILREYEGADPEAVRKILFDAYPFGMRKYHPYKMWLRELSYVGLGKHKSPPMKRILTDQEKLKAWTKNVEDWEKENETEKA